MEQAGAPETCPAGFSIQTAVPFELVGVHISAQREVAVKTVRVGVLQHVAPERGEGRVIPYLENAAVRQTAKTPGAYRIFGVV